MDVSSPIWLSGGAMGPEEGAGSNLVVQSPWKHPTEPMADAGSAHLLASVYH